MQVRTLRELIAHFQEYANRCPAALDLPLSIQFDGDEAFPADELGWRMDTYNELDEQVDGDDATFVLWYIGCP
jgi:hypothetical protein